MRPPLDPASASSLRSALFAAGSCGLLTKKILRSVSANSGWTPRFTEGRPRSFTQFLSVFSAIPSERCHSGIVRDGSGTRISVDPWHAATKGRLVIDYLRITSVLVRDYAPRCPQTDGVRHMTGDGPPHDLRSVVLLLLAAEGPSQLRLGDNAPLHITLVDADRDGALAALLPALGHRPDPMIGRRVTGLDSLLRELAEHDLLVPTGESLWRLSAAASTSARRELAALPSQLRTQVNELGRLWRSLARAEAQRRSADFPADGAA